LFFPFSTQHPKEIASVYKDIGASTLNDLLTLKMDRNGMRNFTLNETTKSSNNVTVNEAIDVCLEPINVSLKRSKIQLKRATADDLNDMRIQVQKLANHVNEPDAVKTTLRQLKLDGFQAPSPLFYCLLMYDTDTGKACGAATIFFGYDVVSGKFLYLEDLFVEEEYRGRRAGKATMLALATVAQELGCGSFVWQALDWNKPSLEFYGRIGAIVQDNLVTSRFAGEELERFASLPLPTPI
jgi:GNAT superfamily N-acetyltransferase